MNKLGIDILNANYKNLNEVELEISRVDYDKVIENKTIYEIEIKDYKGIMNLKKIVISYKFILMFLIISLVFIYFCSNLIFSIDIVTNDKKMKTKINSFLKDNGVSLYKFKKSYGQLQIIKSKLLEEYKEQIDWVEIENIGSKYIIRFEPRIKTELKKDENYRSLIAKKDAIIYSLDVSGGQILKNRFDYVKKGDVIVSGYIYLNEEIKNTVKATGVVYGEVWYKVTVTEKLNQTVKTKTGKNKHSLVFNFLSKEYQPFNFNKYKNYEKDDKLILKNNLLPIGISFQKQEEISVKKESKNYEEALKNAIKKASTKLEEGLSDKEFIKDYKILNKEQGKDELKVEIFYSVVEKISEYQKIDKYEEPKEDKKVE